MSIAACAALVERGDPERFRAVMAAPVWARERLFPLYAFNLEVARAPWVTKEPLIAEMRLQWWADALAEIGGDGPVRRHEVVTPLAETLDTEAVEHLTRLIEARRQDIGDGPEDGESHMDYLAQTGGALLQAAGRVLGARETDAVPLHRIGYALAAANWLRAYPALIAAGKQPFCKNEPSVLPTVAANGLAMLASAGRPSRPGRIAALASFAARGVLRRAARSTEVIAEGRLDPSPVRTAMTLAWAALRV